MYPSYNIIMPYTRCYKYVSNALNTAEIHKTENVSEMRVNIIFYNNIPNPWAYVFKIHAFY